ncbi:hypothetical protein [Chitinolyticbacter albus]|uniref:hypothetical protein n=1 Tax=Chitinolyticbacter albus TaxID=2961951 RepID=UPI0021092210|nr:hypothetical protein [Chitinolyticbacter albus]
MSKKGNTTGKTVGQPGGVPTPLDQEKPTLKIETPEEASVGTQVLDGLQIGLDVVGLIPGFGEVADLANAGISAARGDFIGAGLSLAAAIPFVGWGATGAKAVKRGVDVADAANDARKAKEAADAAAKVAKEKAEREAREKAEKEAAEAAAKAEKEAAETAAGKGGKGKDGNKTKPKKKMKCGEYGKYGDLKKKTGDGKFDRDHIPSKAALKARAEALKGDTLTKAEKTAIDNAADAIAIPRQAHIDISPTYGQTAANAAKDAGDLAGSARRDVEAMLGKIDEYDADGGCKKAYQKAAKRVLKKNNAEFDKWLADVMKTTKKK